MSIKSNNEPLLVNVESVVPIAYIPKDDYGNLVFKGRQFRQAAREKADTLLEQNLTPIDVGYLPQTAETNKKLNRIYNRRARLGKFINWIAATGLSNLDGGDNPHPTPKLPGANTYQIYENQNKEDEQAVKDALSTQHDYDKQMASQKGVVAASALGTGLGFINAGVIPTAVSTAVGSAGSYAGGKVGEKLDEHFGTKWISPVLAIAGGLYGGYKGYQWAKPAVIPYLMRNPQQKGILVTKEFATDAVADLYTHTIAASKVPTRYGKIKWYGPTMGKTTASKTNTNLVDFDEISRHGLEKLAKKHGMTKQEVMMSQDPIIRNEAKQLLKQMLDDWRLDPASEGKTLVVSKSDVLDYDFDNTPLMLQREEFLRRNAARGETDVANSNDWYNSVMEKGKDRIMLWPDEKGVYISQIEPSTTNPYSRQVVSVFGDKVTPEVKWYVEPTTGSTVYQGISLPNQKAKSFVDDVAMLKYYAEHRPKVQRMNFMKEYPTGKYIGEGAEARVFDAGTNVEKILDFDLATRRYLSPDHYVIKTADNPEELLQLIKSVQTSADFRNRHIFSMPVQPAIVRKPDGSYVGVFTQKKLTPLIPDPNNVNYPISPLEQQIKLFLNRPVMQELYPIRGYNIINGNFNPRTLGPLDGHIQNWGYDENGVLWGIDLMKQGGKCKHETKKIIKKSLLRS